MSITKIFSFLLILSVFIGCGGETNTSNTTDTTTTTTTSSTTPNLPTATNEKGEPALNAAGIWHYTCPSGCEGGGATAIPCPKCGTTLAHNTAYHNNGNATPGATTPSNPISPVLAPSASTSALSSPAIGNSPITTNPVPKAPEPAQNAAGVWHYTCPSGCDGGGGSAIACAKCGTTLAHNTAYHQ